MNTYIVFILTLSLIVGGLYAGSKVAAFGLGSNNASMVESLALKLGTSTDEVQSAFDSMREEHRTEMETVYGERLTEAVAAGDLSEDQKQLILQKHEELQAKHETEMASRQQEREELLQWAADNGINAQYLFGGLGAGRGGMMGGHMGGHGMRGEW